MPCTENIALTKELKEKNELKKKEAKRTNYSLHAECAASCRAKSKVTQHVVKRACSVKVRIYAIVVFDGIIFNPQLKVFINEQKVFTLETLPKPKNI